MAAWIEMISDEDADEHLLETLKLCRTPIFRNVRLTKCALKQASMPTTQRGSFSNVAINARRLICLRKTRCPS